KVLSAALSAGNSDPPDRIALSAPLRWPALAGPATAGPHPRSADRRLRAVHGEPGLDGPFDLVAGNRRRLRRQPDPPQARADLVPDIAGGVHSSVGMAGRPFRG